jgi:hypothetical protein
LAGNWPPPGLPQLTHRPWHLPLFTLWNYLENRRSITIKLRNPVEFATDASAPPEVSVQQLKGILGGEESRLKVENEISGSQTPMDGISPLVPSGQGVPLESSEPVLFLLFVADWSGVHGTGGWPGKEMKHTVKII